MKLADQARDALGNPADATDWYPLVLAAPPRELHVPYPYGTIQAAIDAAIIPGDTVIVHPGTYTGGGNRNLDFNGNLNNQLVITV